jgi:hypothetical protein
MSPCKNAAKAATYGVIANTIFLCRLNSREQEMYQYGEPGKQ